MLKPARFSPPLCIRESGWERSFPARAAALSASSDKSEWNRDAFASADGLAGALLFFGNQVNAVKEKREHEKIKLTVVLETALGKSHEEFVLALRIAV